MSNKGPRGSDSALGSLGPQLVGEKISVDQRLVQVTKLLGEGGYSFAYLVKDLSDSVSDGGSHQTNHPSRGSSNTGSFPEINSNSLLVLKITSIHSRHHRDVAEKEAKLLRKLSHPSIVRIFDACYRGNTNATTTANGVRINPQHMILMEYCDGGNSLTMINELKQANKRFDLPSLIIAFGQICNAVSYLHAQRPPIVHRDLKPVNFLIKNGAYKLGDFGSAVIGHTDLKTPEARMAAEEVIQKTTTQMFRSPEMVDLFMAKRLTQSTDIWALGCCLYSMAFFQNCFDEGSNLAILSSNYKIPDDNPYGERVVDLIQRMLTINYKERADISEVILCLSSLYSDRSLPPRKQKRNNKSPPRPTVDADNQRFGTFRTDGQGIKTELLEEPIIKPVEAKKLNPNSAASRRLKASQSVETKNSSSWEQDRVASFGSKDDHPETLRENLFSVNPFDSDDVFIRKISKDDDISFGNFESSTVWKSNIETHAVSKEDRTSSHRKSHSMSDVTHRKSPSKSDSMSDVTHRKSPSKSDVTKSVHLDPGSSDSSIGIEISISKRDFRENLPLGGRPMDADIEYMMRETTLLDDIRIDPMEETEKQEKKKRFSFRRIDSSSVNS